MGAELAGTIIALEDDPAVRNLLSNMLSGEGFTVRRAGSVAEFEALQGDGRVDLYLIDVSLPDGNGLAVLRRLKAKSAAGVIILTGRGDETDHVVGLELGADDYVTKPFRRRELLARIHAVLRRVRRPNAAAEPPPDDHAFDGYRVSLAARRVLAPDGSEVALTSAEFELLAAFLHRRGQALSRDELIRLAKGRAWEMHDRAVDGLVSRLRRKLPPSDGRAAPYIRTVHGHGYAFSD